MKIAAAILLAALIGYVIGTTASDYAATLKRAQLLAFAVIRDGDQKVSLSPKATTITLIEGKHCHSFYKKPYFVASMLACFIGIFFDFYGFWKMNFGHNFNLGALLTIFGLSIFCYGAYTALDIYRSFLNCFG